MNCRDAIPFLEHLSRSQGVHDIDRVAVRDHVASCTACQRTLQSLARWDAQLSVSMNDVSIPQGLSQRLLAGLSDVDTADSTSKPVLAAQRNWWSRALTSAVLIGLLCVAVWSTRHFLQRPSLSPGHIASVLERPIDNLPEASDSRSLLPQQWPALKGLVITRSGKKMDLDDLRLSLVAFPLDVRHGRGLPIEGALFVVPKSRWASTTSGAVSWASVSEATIQYTPQHEWIAWSGKGFVYILALKGHSQLLEQLRSQMGGNNAFL